MPPRAAMDSTVCTNAWTRAAYAPNPDSILFERTLPILQKLRKPFYAQIVTFSGHDPVETTFGSALRQAGIPDRNVMNYLIITQFVDRSIGRFIEHSGRPGSTTRASS